MDGHGMACLNLVLGERPMQARQSRHKLHAALVPLMRHALFPNHALLPPNLVETRPRVISPHDLVLERGGPFRTSGPFLDFLVQDRPRPRLLLA